MLSANPANNVIKNNVGYHYYAGASKHRIADYIIENGIVENNPLIRVSRDNFDAWLNGDLSLLTDSRTTEQCPDFAALPFDKIGRNK